MDIVPALCRLLFVLIALGAWTCCPAQDHAVDNTASRFRASLSEDERTWLKLHPVLQVGNGPDFQPFYAWNEEGRFIGPAADYLELLSRRTGLSFQVRRFADFPAALAALDGGQIQMVPTLTPTEERKQKYLFTGGYLHSPAVVITRTDLSRAALPSGFEHLRVAIERGHASRDLLHRAKPGAVLVEVDDTASALRAVSTGEADAYVGMLAVANYYMESLGLTNLQVRQRFDADLSAMGMAVHRDQPVLHAILRKAMLFVSDAESGGLLRRYLPNGSGVPGEAFGVTPAEQAWLRSHGPIRLGYDQAFYPLSYTDNRHQAEGYSIQLFRLLRDKAGLAVDEQAGPWTSVLDKAIRGEVDVLVAVANSAERRDKLIFVGPYLSSPTAIVTRSNYQQVWDLAEFSGRKLALIEDHFLINRIRSAYPGIRLVPVTSQEDALRMVAAGSADVAIGNLHAVNRLIQSRFLGKLYIAGHVPDGDSELYFGVSKNAPELANLLRRALDSVSTADIAAAKNRWLDTQYTPSLPISEITTFIGPPFAVLATLLLLTAYWTRRLKKELAFHQHGMTAMQARLRELETLTRDTAHELQPTLASLEQNTARMQEALAHDDRGATATLLGALRKDQARAANLIAALLAPTKGDTTK